MRSIHLYENGKHPTRRQGSPRTILVPLLCALLALSLLGLPGCKESDSIVEWVLDQNSSYVDKDNPDKFYVPDESAEQSVDDLQLDVDKAEKQDRVKRDLPTKEGTHDRKKVKSRTKGSSSDDSTSPQEQTGGTKKSKNVKGDPDSKGKSKADDGDKGAKGDKGGDQGDSEDPETGRYQVNMGDDSYLNRTYDNSNGTTEDLPDDVTTVVASGKLATAVLMLGDADTLVGSSKEYLNRASVKKVFSAKTGKAKALWDEDSGKLDGKAIDKIVEAKPSAALVTSGQITSKQERAIAQNLPDCRVITLPAATSDSGIRTIVKAIGKMLSKATDGASSKTASAYLDFIDDEVLDVALDAHPGGPVTYNAVDYSSTDMTNIATIDNPSSEQLWTLYISNWDSDAKVTASYDGSTLFTDTGAAYTNIGWQWSPLSYYMSVGGVINNAAAYGPLSTASVQPVLQYNENQVSYKWSDFAVDVDESKGGGSFSRYRAFYVLTNGRDAAEIGGGNSPSNTHPLGSDDFDTVIVANEDIKDALEKARKEDDGLYTLYGYQRTASGNGYGRKYTSKRGTSLVYTTVKGDAKDGAGFDIYVNPCGYVESWTDGSVESPLESLWIANKYWGLARSTLRSTVKKFYQQFYGYDEVDVSKVLSGAYAK